MSVISENVTPPVRPARAAHSEPANSSWMSAARELRDGYLRGYHRHEVAVDALVPRDPVLFVCNHGFGGVVDLNAMAAARALRSAGAQRPTTALVHQMAWSMGAGPLVEAIGGRPA